MKKNIWKRVMKRTERVYHREAQASYTVEAAILMPILLFVIAACIRTGIDKYQEVSVSIEESGELDLPDVAKEVRFLLFCEDIMEEIKWK